MVCAGVNVLVCAAGDLEGCEGFLDRIQGSLASTQELAEASKPRMPLQNLRVLMQFMHNDLLLASLGATKEVRERAIHFCCHCVGQKSIKQGL